MEERGQPRFGERGLRWVVACWWWLLPLVLAASTEVGAELTDTFHEGEYLGFLWPMRAYLQGRGPFPLLIHGGIDFLPSLLAARLWGVDHVVTGTRVINSLLAGLTWVVFLRLCLWATAGVPRRGAWPVVIAAGFLIMAPHLGSSPLQVQQAFLSVRDLMLLLTVLGAANYLSAASPGRRRAGLALAALAAGVAPFWCYDRGLMAAAFLGAIGVAALVRRRPLDAVAAATLWAAAVGVVQAAGLAGTAAENLRNILYWVGSSGEIWGLGAARLPAEALLGSAATILLGLSMIALVFAWAIRRGWAALDEAGFLAGLLAVQLLLVKTTLNRPHATRAAWAVWPALLLLCYLGARIVTVPALAWSWEGGDAASAGHGGSTPRRQLVALALALVATTAMVLFVRPPLLRLPATFALAMARPKEDATLVPPGAWQAAALARADGSPCTFSWTNDGVTTLLTGKPLCSRFAYGVYVSRASEAELLRDLEAQSPGTLVLDHGHRSMAFDGRHMDDRLPAVSRWIHSRYQAQQRFGPYLVGAVGTKGTSPPGPPTSP